MTNTAIEYAGFWRRFAAITIDLIIILISGFVISFFFTIFLFGNGITDGEALEFYNNMFGLIYGWIYFAGLESSPRQATFGKRLIGIKVTDLDGNRISFGKATARYFSKIISSFIFMIGYIMAGLTQKKQALHDMIAGCLVIVDKEG